MSYPEYVQRLQKSYKKAKTNRAVVDREYHKFLKLAHNREKQTPTCYEDPSTVNIVWSNVQTVIGLQDPDGGPWEYRVTPRKAEARYPSLVMESVLNYWVDRYRLYQEELKTRTESVILGRGWMKVGWDFDSLRDDRHAVVTDFEVDEAITMLEAYVAAGKLPPDALPERAWMRRYLERKYAQTKVAEPWLRHVPWHEMYFDPDCHHIDDARWIAQESWVPLRDLKRDKALNGARNEIEAQGWSDVVKPWESSPNDEEGSIASVRKVEMWDKDAHQLLIWVDGQEGKLLYDERWPYQCGQPFIPIDCFEVSGSPWPMGVTELIAGQQHGMRSVRERMDETRASIRTVVAVEDDIINDSLKKAFASGDMLSFGTVPSSQDGRPLSTKFHALTPAEVNPEWFRADAQYAEDAQTNIGLSNVFRGMEASGTHRTVSEISNMLSNGQARLVPMMQRVRNGRIDVGRKLAQLAQQFMDADDVVPIRGLARLTQDNEDYKMQMEEIGAFAHGETMMFPFNRKSITGEFDFSLSTSGVLPKDKATAAQEAISMLNVLGQFPEFDRRRGIEYAVSVGFPTVSNPEDFILDQPAPMDPMGSAPGGAAAAGGNTGALPLGGA